MNRSGCLPSALDRCMRLVMSCINHSCDENIPQWTSNRSAISSAHYKRQTLTLERRCNPFLRPQYMYTMHAIQGLHRCPSAIYVSGDAFEAGTCTSMQLMPYGAIYLESRRFPRPFEKRVRLVVSWCLLLSQCSSPSRTSQEKISKQEA
jgi:hypothetical protein